MPEKKEPFVPQADRPEVKMDPDKPLSELRVRDLQAILGSSAIKKLEKVEHKDLKPEKYEKHEKLEHKDFKFEKIEHKELKFEKLEKIELEPGPKQIFEPGPDPTQQVDPALQAGLAQLVQTVAGLVKRVDEMANQMAELQKKGK